MESCSICTSAIKNQCTLPCNHSFCSVCIATWFTRSTSCPLCRHDCSRWANQWAQQTDSPLLIQLYHRFPAMFDQDDGPPPLLEEDEGLLGDEQDVSFFSSQDPIVTFHPSPTRHPSQEPELPGPVPFEEQNRTLQWCNIWNYEPIAYTEASDPMVESDDEDDVENYRAMWNDIGQMLNYVES